MKEEISYWYSLTPLIIGWLLGLLSPLLGEFIQRPSKRRQIKKSVFVQLRHLRYQCAGLAFLVRGQAGTLNRAFVEWTANILDKDKGEFDSAGLYDQVRSFLKLDDRQMAITARAASEPVLQMRRISIDFLVAQVPNLHLFQPEFQRLYHEILGSVAIINSNADMLRSYELKTFDDLPSDKHAAVLQNHRNASQHIGNLAEQCAKLITDIENL
ncbi:MAG: hypothetical protein IPL32_01950 [Chloracidobacterium sp.]|nr:hypothetical protein [Chloracidobacterium sp.]